MNAPKKVPKLNVNAQVKVLTLVTCIAGLSMGNQSCQPVSTAGARILKMDIDVGTLNAKTVTLPDGETVDFPYVVNSLFYQQVMKNDHFVINNPIATTSTKTSGSSSKTLSSSSLGNHRASESAAEIAVNDASLLQKFGFLKSGVAEELRSESATNTVHANAASVANASASAPADPNACLYDLPQATMGGEVDSFAVTGGGGISVGYTTGGVSSTTTTGIGGTLQYTAATLQMGFNTVDPLTSNVIVVADGVSVQSKIAASVAFPAGGVPLGLNFFYNTPIAKAISSSMDKGLASMVKQYTKMLSTTGNWNDVWESRVVFDPQISDQDTTVAMRGGYRAGVQVGDQFSVTNLHYSWEGASCNSLLKYKVPLSSTPIAVIRVIAVGDNVSVAQVVSYSGDTKIQSGAQVKISQLYVAPSPSPAPSSSPTPSH